MARLLIEGFEHGGPVNNLFGVNKWAAGKEISIVAAPTGMKGSYALGFTSGYGFLAWVPASALSEIYAAFLWRPTAEGGAYGNTVLVIYDSSFASIAQLFHNQGSPYALDARVGGTTVASTTTGLRKDTTYLVEFHYKPLNTGGVWQVKINGTLEIDWSGDSTSGAENIGMIGLGNPWNNSFGLCNGYFDDVIFDDAEWVHGERPSQIQAIFPTGAGSSGAWTGAYSDVDEKPAVDADAIEVNADAQKHLFALGDLQGSVEAIKCIQMEARVSKEGPATAVQAIPLIRTNSQEFEGAVIPAPEGTPRVASKLWQINPATSAAFTPDEVNSLEAGLKSST